ncbi:hypothetical protein PR048_015234 [Dryococelus australis]|uniref:DNA repair protein SWI5 homolog n=1 Tax=Dryococelus australis TaxID=614101 RepID=A0ABQ9HGD6_9NEOP|nr:hypothetical protein PR048_015234 [Dryococelus australis]
MAQSSKDGATISDPKYIKLLELQETEKQLDKKIAELNEKFEVVSKTYVAMLNTYNETKDATQTILGALARVENVSVEKLHHDYALPISDSLQ